MAMILTDTDICVDYLSADNILQANYLQLKLTDDRRKTYKYFYE